MQSEWEYWLDEEMKRCRTARDMLRYEKDGGSGGSGNGNESSNAETTERVMRYCGACEDMSAGDGMRG